MESIKFDFYVNKFSSFKTGDDFELGFLSPITKRRLDAYDKTIIHTLNKVFNSETQNIVFSSRFGEIEKLAKLIKQYESDFETSPNTFSSSVHNFPVGFFLSSIKKSINYQTISAGENSISTGFLTSVISKYNNNIFCYGDSSISFAINFSKNKKENSKKYSLIMKKSDKKDNYNDWIKLFNNETNLIKAELFELKRVYDI